MLHLAIYLVKMRSTYIVARREFLMRCEAEHLCSPELLVQNIFNDTAHRPSINFIKINVLIEIIALFI
jgi:hypothetical protein